MVSFPHLEMMLFDNRSSSLLTIDALAYRNDKVRCSGPAFAKDYDLK